MTARDKTTASFLRRKFIATRLDPVINNGAPEAPARFVGSAAICYRDFKEPAPGCSLGEGG
jgi:hypothetical protein